MTEVLKARVLQHIPVPMMRASQLPLLEHFADFRPHLSDTQMEVPGTSEAKHMLSSTYGVNESLDSDKLCVSLDCIPVWTWSMRSTLK